MSRVRKALTVAALLCCAQTQPSAPSGAAMTLADARRLIKNSNAFSQALASSLRWRDPAPQHCTEMREHLAATAQPVADLSDPLIAPGAQPFGSAAPINEAQRQRIEIEMIQRTEENCLARHAIMTELIFEAVSAGCLES